MFQEMLPFGLLLLLLIHSGLAVSQKSTGLTDQALIIRCSAKNFLPVRHVTSATALQRQTFVRPLLLPASSR